MQKKDNESEKIVQIKKHIAYTSALQKIEKLGSKKENGVEDYIHKKIPS